MYINDELIDPVPIFPTHEQRVHVDLFRHRLLPKHSLLPQSEDHAPTFSLEEVPSRLNQQITSLTDMQEQVNNGSPLYPKSRRHKE